MRFRCPIHLYGDQLLAHGLAYELSVGVVHTWLDIFPLPCHPFRMYAA